MKEKMKESILHYLGMAVGISMAGIGGVSVYETMNQINESKEKLATVSAKLEETKQERANAESRLERCFTSSENQYDCFKLSFHDYKKLNNEYNDLHRTSEELTESIGSGSEKGGVFVGFMAIFGGLTVGGLMFSNYMQLKRNRRKIADILKGEQ